MKYYRAYHNLEDEQTAKTIAKEAKGMSLQDAQALVEKALAEGKMSLVVQVDEE